MTAPWDDWDHVLKIDPDKDLVGEETFDDVCATGTDAIEIGGSTGITESKMQQVIDACAEHDVPLYQEPNQPTVVVDSPDLDGYLIPIVFNAGHPFWITGAHKEWVRTDGELNWDRTTTEAYIVLNPDATAATLTEADCELSAEDVTAYAQIAEQLYGQEIIYIEYSGMLGDPEIVASVADTLTDSALFYGGGIHDYESARTMGAHADVVVVGDLVHDEGVDAVRETVEGAKDAKARASD
jgi:phosphoglycerol geranylgeranyltransferase